MADSPAGTKTGPASGIRILSQDLAQDLGRGSAGLGSEVVGRGDGVEGVSGWGLVVSPPADWGELVQIHDDREAVRVAPDELPVIDIHSL